MTKNSIVNDNWWPSLLHHIPAENPLASKHVVVAEISRPCGPQSYRHLYTALAPPELVKKLLNYRGEIGHNVDASGPHPASYKDSFNYEPKFWIFGGDIAPDGLEPLVVAWRIGTKTVMLPDQGFLMTYGLVPRTIKSEKGDVIHWDDLEKPLQGVVEAKMVSEDYFGLQSEARVVVDRDYLRDYATVRKCSLVQVYYARNDGPLTPGDEKVLSGSDIQTFKLKGRFVDLRIQEGSQSQVIAQVWGIRHLLDPNTSPVFEGRWDYGNLLWPGIRDPVTGERARHLGMAFVYVGDTVLQEYENHPEKYEIHPESGAVGYGNQWHVGYCQRIGRDLIQLEVKKIYEGTPPDVVRHYNNHAVEPPTGDFNQLRAEPNVATRSKRIVYGLAGLGEAIADIANLVLRNRLTSKEYVNLSRAELDYSGWWEALCVPPITRHIPLSMSEKQFFARCKDLNVLLIECLSEKNLRKLVLALHVNPEEIKELRSLKLLEIFIQHAMIVSETGLSLLTESEEIEKRRQEKISKLQNGQHLPSPLGVFFQLYDLRLKDAHYHKNINDLLERLGTDRASLSAGWGKLLDELYDRLGSVLENMTRILKQATE